MIIEALKVVTPPVLMVVIAYFQHRKKRKDEAMHASIHNVVDNMARDMYSVAYVDFENRTIEAEKKHRGATVTNIHGEQEVSFVVFRESYRDGLKNGCKLLKNKIEEFIRVDKKHYMAFNHVKHIEKTAETLQAIFYAEVGKRTGQNGAVAVALEDALPIAKFEDIYRCAVKEAKFHRRRWF